MWDTCLCLFSSLLMLHLKNFVGGAGHNVIRNFSLVMRVQPRTLPKVGTRPSRLRRATADSTKATPRKKNPRSSRVKSRPPLSHMVDSGGHGGLCCRSNAFRFGPHWKLRPHLVSDGLRIRSTQSVTVRFTVAHACLRGSPFLFSEAYMG
jgi:hypothetical protein